jgi:hypothetical protein
MGLGWFVMNNGKLQHTANLIVNDKKENRDKKIGSKVNTEC